MKDTSPLRQCYVREDLVKLHPQSLGQIIQPWCVNGRTVATFGLDLTLLLKERLERIIERLIMSIRKPLISDGRRRLGNPQHGKLANEIAENALAQRTGDVFHGRRDIEDIPFFEIFF